MCGIGLVGVVDNKCILGRIHYELQKYIGQGDRMSNSYISQRNFTRTTDV